MITGPERGGKSVLIDKRCTRDYALSVISEIKELAFINHHSNVYTIDGSIEINMAGELHAPQCINGGYNAVGKFTAHEAPKFDGLGRRKVVPISLYHCRCAEHGEGARHGK